MPENIIPILIAIFVVALFAAVALRPKDGKVKGRLSKLSTESKTETRDFSEKELNGMGRFMAALLSMIGTDISGFHKSKQMQFYRAGIVAPEAPVYFLFFKRIGIVVFLVLAYFTMQLPGGKALQIAHAMSAILLVVAGIFGPDLYVNNLIARRKHLLQRAFPDTLDLLLVCVESGLALDGALSRVCRELGRVYPEMTQELNRTRLELTLLNDRSQALYNLAERADLVSFRALVTTLLQSEKFGTSLTDTLRVLSEDFRNTRLMLAEEKAGRLPVLMTVPLIMFMMPALFLIILGPTIIQALHAASKN